jgi:4-hydroxybenzoate polyprenyltransferase
MEHQIGDTHIGAPLSANPYLLHMRPRSWPIVATHAGVGVVLGLATGPAPGAACRAPLALLAWAVLLNGGTLALNSAFDRDTDDIGYLDSPPPPPPHLAAYGIGAMLLGGVVSCVISPLFALAYGISLVMSLAYSCPPLRLKARAGWDILINTAGYGALTVFAGWAAVRSETPRLILLIAAGYAALFACLYPLTQVYQYDDDRAKGDRTFTVVLGPAWAVRFATAALLGAFALFTAAGGWRVRSMAVLAPALAAWLAVMVPWLVRGRAYPEKRGMYRGLWAWALTDLAVVVAYAVL